MLVSELNDFVRAAKVGRFYCKKACEVCGRKTQKARKFAAMEKFSADTLKKIFDQDISDGGSLCESCDRAARKAVGSSDKGIKKVSWLIAILSLRSTKVSNSISNSIPT